MARPKKEGGPVPDADRQTKSKAALLKAGGKKVCANLPPETYARFLRIQAKLGPQTEATRVVIEAIDALAAKLRV